MGSVSSTPNPSHTSCAASEKSSSPGPLANGTSGGTANGTSGGIVNGTSSGTANGHHQHPSLVRRQSTCEDVAQDATVRVIDHNNGVYDIEYVMHRPGKFVLDVNMYGMPIDQSPFNVTAKAAGSTCSVHGSEYSTDSPYGPVRPRTSARFSNASDHHSPLPTYLT